MAFIVAWRSAMQVGLSSTHFRPAPGVVIATLFPLQAASMHPATRVLHRARGRMSAGM
jgi:hypothetical protein